MTSDNFLTGKTTAGMQDPMQTVRLGLLKRAVFRLIQTWLSGCICPGISIRPYGPWLDGFILAVLAMTVLEEKSFHQYQVHKIPRWGTADALCRPA